MIRAGYMTTLQERRAVKNTAAAAWIGKETELYFIWGTILYGVTGIDILTTAFTISCVLFNLIIFGYHLLATEDVKTTNTTPGVQKTAAKTMIPRKT